MKVAIRGLRKEVTAMAILGAGVLACSSLSTAATAASTKDVTLYSKATAVQYINNADDSARGMTNNPFNPTTNKLKPKLSFKGSGPFAGDVTVFSFNLFASPDLKKVTGSASYTCYYNYNKKALCDANFQITSGASALVASGPVDFGKTQYSLIVTGGTNKYLGARGQLLETPIPKKNAQRLTFQLLT